eukprot:gene28853-32040_t
MQALSSRITAAPGRSASMVSHARPAVTKAPSPLHRLPLASISSRKIACNGLFGLGIPEIAVIAGVAALVFGPSKLPELGRGLGKTMKSFQTAAKEFETELKAGAEDEDMIAKAPDAPKAEAPKADAPKAVEKPAEEKKE